MYSFEMCMGTCAMVYIQTEPGVQSIIRMLYIRIEFTCNTCQHAVCAQY